MEQSEIKTNTDSDRRYVVTSPEISRNSNKPPEKSAFKRSIGFVATRLFGVNVPDGIPYSVFISPTMSRGPQPVELATPESGREDLRRALSIGMSKTIDSNYR